MDGISKINMEKKTIFLKMECCKCHKNLGMGISNETFYSNSFIPNIHKIHCNDKILNFYCYECYVKEVLNIDL